MLGSGDSKTSAYDLSVIPESIVHIPRRKLTSTKSLLLVKTDFCCSVMESFSSSMHLWLIKKRMNITNVARCKDSKTLKRRESW